MAAHQENGQWQHWSLERVAELLSHRFPGRHVWVVRAAQMYLHKFSCYENFVESNAFGAPEHSPDHGPCPLPPDLTLTLVGFSKGCVVLNQMVYELAGARADPELAPFLARVQDMYWLDGGHPGGSETWVTNRKALQELASSGIGLHAHVTPYEVQDPMRAWVGREHRRFVRTLKELGAPLVSKLHFQDEPPSLDNHFGVIREF
ncbi:CB069 protein, partial [Amia calva]|nr:CB069 protein [Amia calva]